MPTALITGERGLIGRHFRSELGARGWRVYGCDIKDNEWADCRDLFTRNETYVDFDLVIHAAAIIGGRKVIDGNPLATAENIELDSMYFRWLARVKPKHAIYLSSSAVYPIDMQTRSWQGYSLREGDINLKATHRSEPDQVYGWSKLVGEMLARKTIEAGVPVSIVRPFSGYGVDQDLDYPFPSFIQRSLRGDDPFEMWGDGTQTRDFIHVDDVINGALAVVEHDQQHPGDMQPVNLCTGRPTSFDQLAWLIFDITGRKAQIHRDKDAPTGVNWRVGDPKLMHKIYRPKISLEDGIDRALKEFPDRPDQRGCCPRCGQTYTSIYVTCRPAVDKYRPYCGKVEHYV